MFFEAPTETIHFADCIELLKPEKCELFEANRGFRLVCLRLRNNKCLYLKVTENLNKRLFNKDWIADLINNSALYWGKVKNPIIWLSLGLKAPKLAYVERLNENYAFSMLNRACFIETNLFCLTRDCNFEKFDIDWVIEDEEGNGDYCLICNSKENHKNMRIEDVFSLPNGDDFNLENASRQDSLLKVVYKEDTPWKGKFWALPSFFELKKTHHFIPK